MKRININQLKYRCKQGLNSLLTEIGRLHNGSIVYNKNDRYGYIDNKSNILCVVHADTVFNTKLFYAAENKVYSPSLDDRLGLYLALDYFPHINIDMDILITENEESGNSTAQYFNPHKQYNWIVGLDRQGTGCVLYDYEYQAKWKSAIESFFEIEQGTYSDISRLYHLKACGLNLGIGYKHQHTQNCNVLLDDLYYQLYLFKAFYQEHKDNIFVYEHQDTYMNLLKELENDVIKEIDPIGFDDADKQITDDYLDIDKGIKLPDNKIFYCSNCNVDLDFNEIKETDDISQLPEDRYYCRYCGGVVDIEVFDYMEEI